MIIQIIGCDGCYKTTVGEILKEKLGFPIVKGSSFELAQSGNEELYRHFVGLSKSENIIMDRGFYCNLVYASLYEDFSILTREQTLKLEDLYRPKTLVVYLYADKEIIKERINVRGDDYVKANRIDSIVDRYNEVLAEPFENNRISHIEYDTSTLGSEEIAERVLLLYENFTRGDII